MKASKNTATATATIDMQAIAAAIRVPWVIALNAPNREAWVYHWSVIAAKLNGFWDLVIFSGEDVEDTADLRDQINELEQIARDRQMCPSAYAFLFDPPAAAPTRILEQYLEEDRTDA